MREPPICKGPRAVPNSVQLYGETFYREKWVDKVFSEDFSKLSGQIETLRATLEARQQTVVEALEFYADPETYHACAFLFDPPCGGFDDDFGDLKEHGHPDYDRPMPGKCARKALAALETKPEGDV